VLYVFACCTYSEEHVNVYELERLRKLRRALGYTELHRGGAQAESYRSPAVYCVDSDSARREYFPPSYTEERALDRVQKELWRGLTEDGLDTRN
jgi:hypothetical protein